MNKKSQLPAGFFIYGGGLYISILSYYDT